MTDFRAHLANVTNCVAWRHDRCVITRHGQEIGALVSYEDLMFLRKYKPRKIGPPSVDVFNPTVLWEEMLPQIAPQPPAPPPPPEAEAAEADDAPLEDPWVAPLEQVEELYALLEDCPLDTPELRTWYGRATGRLGYEKRRTQEAELSPRSGQPCCTESRPEPVAGGTASRS
ncbi:MAG: type II toxin-antitoxin system prevent-host-death family antitoxin [Myxococcales bacterium]